MQKSVRESTFWTNAAGPAAWISSVLFLTGCLSTPGSPPAPMPSERPAPPGSETAIEVQVDPERELVVMEAGPFTIPASASAEEAPGGHAHPEAGTPLLLFEWPVDGWYRGYGVRLVDARGDAVPQRAMHHVIGVNFERRQLVYPVPERFMGTGTETRDILLPKAFGVPMEPGSRLGVYAAWQNETGRPIEDVYIQVVLAYTPRDGARKPEEVVPIYMDTNNVIGETNAFDLPPGRTTRTYEFTLPVDGGLLGLSGHLHDYGRAVRLEDVETGKVLVELEGSVDDSGRLEAVEQRIFRRLFGLLDDRVPLEAGRRYRVVGEYFNPTDETIERGAMAHLSGIFAPEEIGPWSRLDTGSELYRKDVAALPPPLPATLAPPGLEEHRHSPASQEDSGG